MDAGHDGEAGDVEGGGGAADAGEDGLGGTGGAVYVEAELDHLLDDLLDVLFGGVALHDYDHSCLSSFRGLVRVAVTGLGAGGSA